MPTATLREIMQTHWRIALDRDHTDGSWRVPIDEDAMRAVLRKIEPMIAATWLACIAKLDGEVDDLDRIEADEYAARWYAALLSPPTEGSKE